MRTDLDPDFIFMNGLLDSASASDNRYLISNCQNDRPPQLFRQSHRYPIYPRMNILKPNSIGRGDFIAQLMKIDTLGYMGSHRCNYIPAVKGSTDGIQKEI